LACGVLLVEWEAVCDYCTLLGISSEIWAINHSLHFDSMHLWISCRDFGMELLVNFGVVVADELQKDSQV
jgi:hypothetical protein